MRYYKYTLNYLYSGFEDSDTEITSSTTVEPINEDYILYNPDTNSWEQEPEDILTFEQIQAQYQKDNLDFFDEYMDGIYEGLADFEPATFRSQEDEWRAWSLDDTASTPYVDVLCAKRGIDKITLMAKIGYKVQGFADLQGTMHSLDDLIASCTTQEQLESLPLPWL